MHDVFCPETNGDRVRTSMYTLFTGLWLALSSIQSLDSPLQRPPIPCKAKQVSLEASKPPRLKSFSALLKALAGRLRPISPTLRLCKPETISGVVAGHWLQSSPAPPPLAALPGCQGLVEDTPPTNHTFSHGKLVTSHSLYYIYIHIDIYNILKMLKLT